MPIDRSPTRGPEAEGGSTSANHPRSDQPLQGNNSNGEVSLISSCHVELSPFYQADPRSWFAQVDLVFANFNITRQQDLGMSPHNYPEKHYIACQTSSLTRQPKINTRVLNDVLFPHMMRETKHASADYSADMRCETTNQRLTSTVCELSPETNVESPSYVHYSLSSCQNPHEQYSQFRTQVIFNA